MNTHARTRHKPNGIMALYKFRIIIIIIIIIIIHEAESEYSCRPVSAADVCVWAVVSIGF